ncbi:hypothetical protein EV385_0486 [Krasilnikovia cinnamomea]|uniref:Uncharacterized protein n=1 Tax=Krasilnikovia cinnamomea TaxID=349313 RepID=A0A4Q7ZDJ2_9ACTN|nr:hypothetical protein [Krasilnikovia cinnamomea]RZU48762.1 hypothetical protein EV385_0486 [Krasilnikovia cinnamomea]
MRDISNLLWPEAPFGAEQRPFGRARDMLTAVAIDWAVQRGGEPLPVGAAAVYLGVRRHGNAYEVNSDTLSIGFRTTVIDTPDELPELLAILDRTLTRARRQAAILAGHRLGGDLARILDRSRVPLRGAAGVIDVWAHRMTKTRGLARMVDTAVEAATTGADLDMPLPATPVALPTSPDESAQGCRRVLARALAIGLTAAVHTGRYHWEGQFRVREVTDRETWDLLPADTATQPVPPLCR